jgi:hypothetical protein
MQTEFRALFQSVAGTVVFVIAGCSGGGGAGGSSAAIAASAAALSTSTGEAVAPLATAADVSTAAAITAAALTTTAAAAAAMVTTPVAAATAAITAVSPEVADGSSTSSLPSAAAATFVSPAVSVSRVSSSSGSGASSASAAAPQAVALPAATASPPASPQAVAAAVPAPAAGAGYNVRTYGPTLTLEADKTSAPSGSPLYRWAFFGETVAENSVIQNSDGSITFKGAGNGNAQAASASPADTTDKFHGVAFGGGAYFEAVIKFDGWQTQLANPTPLSGGFPSFWSMAIEHLAGNGADHWPNQKADYMHFVEYDFFEYNAVVSQKTEMIYSGTIHDWYGIFGVTCPEPLNSFCNIMSALPGRLRGLPKGTNLSEYHTYSALWVPATAQAAGYMRWFFDGTELGQTNTWDQWTNPAGVSTPPGMLEFGVGDSQHVALILGTGVSMPMTVSSISVWQASAAKNLTK